MRTISKILALFAVIAITLVGAGPVTADPLVFGYHGWQVDLTNARGAEPDKEMVAAVKRQLDIVEHVHLKPEVLTFMRTIPIWANPAAAGFGPGHYSSKTGIDLRVRSLDPDKPIILHELLHAYNDRMLPGGFGNRDIRQFFSSGRGLWPGDSYMMSNHREFFAVTASVYLYGDIDRPPYSRSQLREKQPRYYQWLATLFDDGRPRS
ncbi:hypothetical protein [Rhizobium lentis]|uniref:Uncharacterized protein n=1 Tax=Rhizobium lentis TaxID=1138194 RepID=A0ABS7IBP4_9HYPH|nr:hypothetical protein [Rhizobium lentis]MBX4957230.1 hypothetical protein [Rhizobium lentis]MBX4975194.1 hypothetical protein [Rhizobium lentis]MBX4987220.1 hypothetical protein [Rhizobium lentis]MBX5001770.1 hypothetical protein [Rhizobium lentis]MBX5005664.1 hypothetical protein [Rhizobium lentis]